MKLLQHFGVGIKANIFQEAKLSKFERIESIHIAESSGLGY